MLYKHIYTYLGNIFILYFIGNIYNKKIKKPKLLPVYALIMMLSYVLNLILEVLWIKSLLVFLIMIIVNKLAYKQNNKGTLISSFIMEVLIIISELLVSMVFVLMFDIKKIETFTKVFNVDIFSISLIILLYIFTKNKRIHKIYKYIMKKTRRIKDKNLLYGFLFFSFSASTILIFIFFSSPVVFTLIFSILFILLFSTIIIMSFKNYNDKKISDKKYSNALLTLQQYEKMLNRYKMITHENKNQYVTLQYLIDNDNIELSHNYISEIINISYSNDETILFKTSKIPDAALRSVTYNKIIEIKDKNLDYYLKINDNLKTYAYVEIEDVKIAYDITRLFSIFVDNAIQEIQKNKKGCIGIEMYIEDNKLYIEISNTIEGLINATKIEEAGYTTKSDGHGYGLCLAQKIITKNKRIENKRYIFDGIFKQIIIIKL